MTKLQVVPWSTELRSEAPYDGFIASLGFEQRASFLARTKLASTARCRFACGFGTRQLHAYDGNLRVFAEAGFEIDERPDEAFPEWWKIVVNRIFAESRHKGSIRLCVDVSSMSRFRIATIVASLFEGADNVAVDFLYSIAAFSGPPKDALTPITVCGPAVDTFAGWSVEPEVPQAAIIGIGYEEEKAVGAWEFLEPAEAWVFRPSGEDLRYDRALEKANRNLWRLVPRQNVIDYRVDQPFDCFAALEALTYGKTSSRRVTLVPFGPKIFTLSCLLVGCLYWPRIAVWRVSSGQLEPAVDRVANGKVIGLRVDFQASAPLDSASLLNQQRMNGEHIIQTNRHS